MVQNWNLGIQYELPWRTKLEANYVGNHGARLNDPYVGALNQVDPKYLSLGDVLLHPIMYHPEIPKPYPSFDGIVSMALRPFPQYLNVTAHRTNEGWSNYHSAQFTLTKRTSRGLSFLVAYTWSKALGTTSSALGGGYGQYGQSIYNRAADYGVTGFNIPHSLKISWIYDLPFGKDRKWLREGFMSHLLGGWTMSAVQRYQSGSPMGVWSSAGPTVYALFNNGYYTDVLLPHDQQVIAGTPDHVDETNGVPYLNPKAFSTVPMTAWTVPLRLGTGTSLLPNVRGWAAYGEDFSLMKKFALPFREGSSFELRADVTNLFNRIGWAAPETDIGDPLRFGRSFGKSGSPRMIQMGARISF
jgi:hypothetical protein